MARVATLTLSIAAAVVAGYGVPIVNLQTGTQPLIVFLSIMAAAILVRLNRGMPAIDWKTVSPPARKELTLSLYEIAKEYAAVLAVLFLSLLALLGLVIGGRYSGWAAPIKAAAPVFVGGLVGLMTFGVIRMAYVVWRDIDIVRLQKDLLDRVADEDAIAEQVQIARDKVESINRTRLPR